MANKRKSPENKPTKEKVSPTSRKRITGMVNLLYIPPELAVLFETVASSKELKKRDGKRK